MTKSKEEALNEIAAEIQELSESPLYEFRQENSYKPVIGEGSVNARIMFIGEAPGENEAKSGRPFVGASGRLLNELLEGIGAKREDIYITNVVKDRPPENRSPRVGEVKLYTPFLARQIEIIQPQVIAPLGRFSMEAIFKLFDMAEKGGKISQLHGKKLSAKTSYGDISVVPLFHPAVALYTSEKKPELVEDFQVLKEL